MTKGGNKMYTKSDEQFLVIKATIKSNNQESNNNHNNTDEKLTILTDNQKDTNETLKLLLAEMKIDKNNISKSYPSQKDTSTTPDPTTMLPANRRDPPLDGGQYTNIGGMWTLKHEIRSPKFY